MRRSRGALIAAVGIGALALAGAAASTNSLSFSNSNTTVAYGQEDVTGATVTNISYTLSADGTTITGVTFVASGDTSGSQAEVGFTVSAEANSTTTTTNEALTPCGAGSYSSTDDDTTYACPASGDTISQSVSDIVATDIVVD